MLAGCGGAFADSVKRGDQYAQAGMWDKAAEEYQAAQRLEPDNTDVAIKLRQIGQKRSGERLARGNSLMARGEIEAGLAVIQEAAKLDPESTGAQRALDDAIRQALKRADELLSTPEARKAFELIQLVLAGSPSDPRARRMDDRVRDALAEQAYHQAEQFLEDGKKGNALIAYAASTQFRPGYRDTKVQIGDVKLALQKETT
jgi:tetratricopeptide (TPR) repeat protein